MAIATGDKELLGFSTTLALIESDAASLSTTRRDGVNDFAMGPGHGSGVALEVLGAEGRKDFTDGGHDRVPP